MVRWVPVVVLDVAADSAIPALVQVIILGRVRVQQLERDFVRVVQLKITIIYKSAFSPFFIVFTF